MEGIVMGDKLDSSLDFGSSIQAQRDDCVLSRVSQPSGGRAIIMSLLRFPWQSGSVTRANSTALPTSPR